jgi:hypothetical protein
MNRKEKENEFHVFHMKTFKQLKLADPSFALKTAFFSKGKFGKQIQLFEGELNKGNDIFIELIDIIRDSDNKEIDLVPANADRQLFKYTYNPYFAEEYETKEGLGKSGTGYVAYVIPTSELVAILDDGSQITYNLWEKRKLDADTIADSLPKLQSSPTIFPDFVEAYASTPTNLSLDDESSESMVEICKRISNDFEKLAIALSKIKLT